MIIDLFKKILKPISDFWFFHLIIHGLNILFKIYIYYPLFKLRYRKLKKFKNIHLGGRCFIVATGPSLTLEDVNKLKDETTFGMNSVYKLFSNTSWRPSYYVIQDYTVFKRIYEDIKEIDFNCSFSADYLKWKQSYRVPFKRNWCDNAECRRHIPKSWRIPKMSNDISKYCYEGTTVVNFILQICFYMGFKEIYLLGTDCNYQGKNTHSKIAAYKDSDKLANSPDDLYEGMMEDYELAKKIANSLGVKIYNATRGGMLEKFERVDLDEVLNFQKKCKS